MTGLDVRASSERGADRDGIASPVRLAVDGVEDACAGILNDWIDATPWMRRVHPIEAVIGHYRDDVLALRRVWVAGDPVEGFLALDEAEDLVTALYLAAPARGRGLGRALLNRAKEGRSRLRLWTFAANEGARRFYAREGFRSIAASDGDNEEGLADILFEWRG